MMKTILWGIILSAWLFAFPGLAAAADQDDASRAAREILRSLQQSQFENLWNTQTSEFFKSKMTKDAFMANLTMSKQPLGSPGESKFIDMSYAQTDPSTGFQREIYQRVDDVDVVIISARR